MDTCINVINEKVRKTKFYQLLKTNFGEDTSKILEYYLKVSKNGEFTEAFRNYYFTKHHPKTLIHFDNFDENVLLDTIKEFINNDNPDGNDSIERKDSKDIAGFSSVGDRRYCIQRVAKQLNSIWSNHHYNLHDDKNLNRYDYYNILTNHFYVAVLDKTSSILGITKKDLVKYYDAKKAKDIYIELKEEYNLPDNLAKLVAQQKELINACKRLLGDDITPQLKNLIATTENLLDYQNDIEGNRIRDKFLNEVLLQGEVTEFKKHLYNIEHKVEEGTENKVNETAGDASNDGTNVDETGVPVEFQVDETLKDLDNHDGQLPTFMMHLSNTMQSYFNSLPRLRTTHRQNELYDYDVNNPIGLSDTMTASECAAMLYSRAKTNGNIDEFIESIREIAESVPGFESFIKLYDDLRGHFKTQISPTGEEESIMVPPNYAFAEELFDTFAKTVVAKKELYIDKEGNLKARISNNMTNPKDSFRLQCISSVRNSAIALNYFQSFDEYNNIKNQLDAINKLLIDGKFKEGDLIINYNTESEVYLADKRALINDIYKVFKWYYSDISLASILNYVNNNTTRNVNSNNLEIDEIKNINNLLSLLYDTISAGKETRDNYEIKIDKAANARYHNENLRSKEREDIQVDESEYIDLKDIYKIEHLSEKAKSTAIAVADALLPYTAVKTKFNSRNAAGNNSSDVLNNNMLTYLKRILEHESNIVGNKQSPLAQFAKYKFQNNQYNDSNLLIEHRDSNGNIENVGLFRIIKKYNAITKKTETIYEPTEYATELINITLFNGTSDHLKAQAALYANMSKGDYLVSAFASFYNSIKDPITPNGDQTITFADYFLRTPSDAPKNFILTLPRYSVQGLISLSDEHQIDIDIEQRINDIIKTNDKHGVKNIQQVESNIIFNLLTNKEVDRIYINRDNYRNTEDGCYVIVQSNNTNILVKGTLVKNAGIKYIEDITTIGVVENDGKYISDLFTNQLKDYYKKQLLSHSIRLLNGEYAKRNINRNHPIYRQFYRTLNQEVTNAATALTTLFEKVERTDEVSGQTITTFVENGNIKWKGKFAQSDDPDNMTEETYHHEKGKHVVEHDKYGNLVLTGRCFKSDRFTKFTDLLDKESGKHNPINQNYFEDLFADGVATEEDGRIHMLYGGFNTHLHLNSDGTVSLTPAQKAYVESRLDSFIEDYIDSTYERLGEFENIMPEDVPHDFNAVSEFILNYRLAYFACADLLEGDSKCYKSFTDFLKRAKEVQGAGIPYSALDYTRQICSSREPVTYSSLNSNSTIIDLNNRTKLNDCILYNTFRGVTVKNTVRTSKETQNQILDKLTEVIKNSYKEAGSLISNNAAREKAKYIMGGYKDVKTNDAQSYITFEEWIRRISMRGQLPKYESLIKRICDDSRPITIDDINEFIQVQKNFYYDLYYDKTTNHMRPRQIKNAEFVLVPRLIKGTQLEQVYNTMIAHGIDQLNTVETSKAGKANVLTLWDNNGDLNEDWFNDSEEFNTKVQNAIELYDYNFLYTQQETPQHANTENKAAIQLMKKIIDNVPQYINGKEHPLWKFKVKFHDIYSQNIKESNQDLLQRLNIKYNQDGSFEMSNTDGILEMDAEVFCSMLRDELIRQGSDSQLLDYATLNATPVEDMIDTNGFGLDTKMPIIANNAVRYKFENIAQSLFNTNVTRQTLPGFHAAQITGVGWRNDKEVKYLLQDKENNSNLKEEISSKEWKKLDKKDRVKYIPNNGIGTSTDLAYHPAQYKNKKTGDIILERDWLNLSSNEQSDYEYASTATYIEIRIPKSMFNFNYRHKNLKVKTDDELLLELQNAGLDELIGYRIPTEGKQSIAIMKVVGFVDDSYGSTIVVPDDWVAQTGSDFDIDSVYSVVYNNRVNSKTGRIEKVKYKSNFRKRDYISYIDRRRKSSIGKKVKELSEDLGKDIQESRSNEFISLNEDRDDIYDRLSDKVKGIIKVAQQVKQTGLTNQEVFIQRCQNIINDLNSYLNNKQISDVDKINIDDFINVTQKLLENVSGNKFNNEITKGVDKLYDEQIKSIEDKVKKLGLPTYNEYLKLNDIERNTRKARTNALIDSMLDILKSDWSLEENLSQSNFREVIDARNKVLESNPSDKIAKEARSPYDFIAQADNQEEAISGRTLKGISVASNNTISIANTIRPELTEDNVVRITYPKEIRGRVLNIEALKRRFNNFKTDNKGKELLDQNGEPLIEKENVYYSDANGKPNEHGNYITIKHNKFGWSNDNRNVVEFLLTPYCSQTTAHQLDVIKEGAIPNVNDYTFNIYMLFPSIGSDYDTAIAFMTQPAITRIVNAYNRSKSIYSTRYENPIRSAIIEIAQETNPTIKYYSEAIEHLKTISQNVDNVLNYDNLIKRKQSSDNKSNSAFDYAVIKQFIKFKEISDKINQYTFVLNPDKYGAKQTIFATNEVLNRINDILTDFSPVFKQSYNANGDSCEFLEAVFPGITYAAQGDLDKYLKNADDNLSRYKPMHSFMKYATIPSIIINRRLFKTQDPKFRNIVESIKDVMSGKLKRLTEDTDDSFSSYIISKIYSSIPILAKPIGYTEDGKIIPNIEGNNFRERSRIYGISTLGNFDVLIGDKEVSFNPRNKTNPTPNEIRYFLKMSPAQKVAWCKRYFKDSLVCKYFDVNLSKYNQRNPFNPNGQIIEFLEDVENIENIYEEFRNTLHNTNPFLKLTAIDLIKYAYLVEGRTIKRNSVTKSIPNDVLLESLEEGGTGIIDSLKGKLDELIDTLSKEDKDKLIEDYIRGHANMKEISQVRISTSDRIKYLSKGQNVDGMYVLTDFDKTHDFLINKGIIYEDINPNTGETEIVPNHYVNIGSYIQGKYIETLYKIVKGKYDNQYLLYPLNNLEPNEFGVKSINPDYYKHYKPEYYERIIRNYKTNNEGMTFKDFYEVNSTEGLKEANKLQDVYGNITSKSSKQTINEFDIYSEKASISQLRDTIRDHFNNGILTSNPLYVQSEDLKYYVRTKNPNNPQYIELDGHMYGIHRVPKEVFEKYANKNTPIAKEDYFLTDIINKLRNFNADFSKIGDTINIFCIRPVNTIFSSTTIEVPVAEAVGSANRLINSLAASGDSNAERTASINFREDIGTDSTSISKKLELGLINLKEWANREAELLINGSQDRPGLNMFYKDDETGRWLTMADDKVFAKMLDDPMTHRAFIKTYLDALRFVEKFEQFDGDLKYTDDEIHLQNIVDEINDIVKKVKDNSVFKKVERLYVTEHLAKVSNNPNIQRNIISLLDGFHRTSFLTSHVNDLQDTSNPIIQIITKTSMANIRAAELQMEGEIDIFDNRVKDIIERAKSAGLDINYDKFIDEHGDWKRDYVEDFVNDYNTIKNEKQQAYDDYLKVIDNKGTEYQKAIAFNKYLKSRYKFDEFQLKYINREIEDNYYHELLLNEKRMMNSNGNFIEIYVEFERLNDRKRQLNKMSDADGELDDIYRKELEDITRRLDNLCSLEMIDEFGYGISKESYDEMEFTDSEEKNRILKLDSIEQANELLEYLKNKDLIQKAYIDFDEKDSFRDLFERYTEIINRWEDRDPITNSPRLSETELSTIPEYTYAKQWIRDNCVFKTGLDKLETERLTDEDITNYLTKFFNGEIKEDSEEFKYVLASAFKYFRNRKGSKSNPNTAYKRIAKERDAKDSDGIIDGRKFTKEDLELVKQEELERLGITESTPFAETSIIKNSNPTDVIFKSGFYNQMIVGGELTKKYKETIKKINNILRKAYVLETKTVRSAYKLSEDDLTQLLELFKDLGYDPSTKTFDTRDAIKKKQDIDKSKAKIASDFVKKYVTFEISDEEQNQFNIQKAKAESRGESYFNLWCQVNEEFDEDKGEMVPNHLLWGRTVPKDKYRETYIDKKKTAALRAVTFAYKNEPSKYYEAAQAEMIKKYGRESTEYKEWYELNHVYNTNTHQFEPLSCWTIHSPNPKLKREVIPNYTMRINKVKKGHENINYKKGLGYKDNFKSKSTRDSSISSNVINSDIRRIKVSRDKFIQDCIPDDKYDINLNLNQFEEEIRDYFKQTLSKLAKTKEAKKHLETSLPFMSDSALADKPSWMMEIAKTFGLVDSNRKVYWSGDGNIGYDNDYIPPMPMMQQLTSKETIHPPIREKYNTDESYNKALDEYNNNKLEIDKKNEEIHRNLLDRNWPEVIKEFMRQAAHYNAIQNEKYSLYFGQKLLEDITVYETRPDTHNILKKKGIVTDNNEHEYKKSVDKNLQEQYNNWLYRVIYGYYKQSQGIGERVGNVLQGFTSTSYMTVNLRAGFANVLVGESSVLGEAWARQYFGLNHWAISKRLWGRSIIDYIYHAYDDKADTIIGAIIKGMNIVDYSELNGRITQLDLKQWSKVITDLGFSPNNAGEHMMQNSAMIAMMLSHKVIENPNYGKPGERKYIVVNFEEYTQNVREEVLRQILTKEQEKAYDKWIASIKKDPNGAKNFAWYRDDPISHFLLDDSITAEQRHKFKKLVKDRKNEIKQTFDQAKNVLDQLDKNDKGHMCFKQGSIFEELNNKKEGQEISDAYMLLGEFKGRVIAVNKRIHGNYGKLDSAQIEKYYLGRLTMQYHKHIPTGILKRYRREGYYNEERGTIEKGMYTTLYDFLKFPVQELKKRNEISDDEHKALVSLQNLFSYCVDYFKFLSAYIDVMPEYEVANFRRMLGNISGMLVGVLGAFILKVGWDEDDEEGIAYNFLLYEADRLISETIMWTPTGAISEFKKQWSSPIAAGSIIQDAYKIMETCAGIIFQGSDYDPYYHTGRFSGRHKLGVYFERRIPYWRNYATIRDIASNNHFYKLGDNLPMTFAEALANAIKSDD